MFVYGFMDDDFSFIPFFFRSVRGHNFRRSHSESSARQSGTPIFVFNLLTKMNTVCVRFAAFELCARNVGGMEVGRLR